MVDSMSTEDSLHLSRKEITKPVCYALWAGSAIGGYGPFTYGLWLILVPSDGTSKAGGLLLVSIGAIVFGAVGGLVGYAINAMLSTIPDRYKRLRNVVSMSAVVFAAFLAIVLGVLFISRDATNASIRADLEFVAMSVRCYHDRYGVYPESIDNLDGDMYLPHRSFSLADVELCSVDDEMWIRFKKFRSSVPRHSLQND